MSSTTMCQKLCKLSVWKSMRLAKIHPKNEFTNPEAILGVVGL